VPFTCESCSREFTLAQSVVAKYPNWTPKQCMDCRQRSPASREGAAKAAKPTRRSITSTTDLSTAEVLARFEGGPTDGIFTDGSSRPNPGPGGWGAVYVKGNNVIDERHGADPHTTNNRMELTALIAGLEMAPPDEPVTVYSDSQLVVNTLTKWARGWEGRGWVRKEGPIANLDLVRRAWELVQQRPNARIEWIRAHDGSRWNEYADALSTAHLRSEV
jgi:ribonuclease HI